MLDASVLLLVPAHMHALRAFPGDKPMAQIIGAWKAYQAKHIGVLWQDNFLDYRIRNRRELEKSANYSRLDPVRRDLCAKADAWPWVTACTG
jgi:REP element-mobilizing transposase RayT